ncbi:hypothetical protein AURDEDRAFT_30414, partial [Auricularia subglabra TFB-10046 SS5]
LTLYDLTSTKGAYSPFVWRVRMALNYKKLAYKTHWLTYTTIEPHFKSAGIPPTRTRPDTGADLYTCPALSIDGTFTVDSPVICEQLDTAFPHTPPLFPPGTRALQAAFLRLFEAQVLWPSAQVTLPGAPAIVDATSAAYMRTTRRAWFGVDLDEWAPLGSEARRKAWEQTKQAWGNAAALYAKREGKAWLTGDQPVFADFVVLGLLIFVSKLVPEDEWEAVLGWHDG